MSDNDGDSGAGWLALLGMGINAAGQVWSNARNERLNKIRWRQSVELANTAHQREVEDLRAAGLNPILSSMGGNGAASPDISSATVDNPGGSALQVATIMNQRQQAIAQNKAADAAQLNSETQAWQIYDARTMGYAGFDVGIGKPSANKGVWNNIKRAFGFNANADGKFERVYTIRVNKVTGEAYTVPDNKPIKSFRPVEHSKVNSGKGTTSSVPSSAGEPITIKVNKTERGKSTFEKDNPHIRGRYPAFQLRHY